MTGLSMEQTLELLGQFIVWAISGAIGAGFLIKFGGQKWIENKFQKDLELFKTQTLHEFELLLTRKTKWHEKEHEVLSVSWQKLIKSHTALKQAISMFREIPNLEEMSDDKLQKFFDASDFSINEKSYILDQGKDSIGKAYLHILDRRDLYKAHEEFLEFHTYFEENKIFLRPHIKEKFLKIDDYIWSAWVSRKISLGGRKSADDLHIEAFNEEQKKIKPLIAEIEETIQKELFPSQ